MLFLYSLEKRLRKKPQKGNSFSERERRRRAFYENRLGEDIIDKPAGKKGKWPPISKMAPLKTTEELWKDRIKKERIDLVFELIAGSIVVTVALALMVTIFLFFGKI